MQLTALREKEEQTPVHETAVRFSDVTFSYGGFAVISDASFHVHPGEFVALVGANGAGKTTVLRLILGLAPPDSGSVSVYGLEPRAAQGLVGYVPQHIDFDRDFPISVEQVVRMGRMRGFRSRASDLKDSVDQVLELADIADLKMRPYAALSGGQRRRVLVARALAGEPRLLILDEPTANMDAESERRLYDALGNLKGRTTIMIATHDTSFVSALSDVVLCVGERLGKGRGVVRHASAPAEHVPATLYGGEVVQVLHDTELPDDVCCPKETGGLEERRR